MQNLSERKKILFLSGIDFKEKSIQVIRKTPEYYASSGWNVDYIVARDNVAGGNYSYEKEINPEGVNVSRFYWPITKFRQMSNRYLKLIFSKIASLMVIFALALQGYKKIKSGNYDVVYGYELHGVLALMLIKPFLKYEKIVTRFQGTFLNEMLENKQWLRLLFNADLILALKVKSDLTIMTDDGTEGDKALKKIRGIDNLGNIKFWTNGVNVIEHSKWPDLSKDKIKIVSISRLVGWKRVDRCIKVVEQLVANGFTDFEYEIIGGGELKEKLEQMVKSLSLEPYVKFSGALPHHEALDRLKKSQIFFSMYDSSNVGNPLLEAIRANKIIVTLNNGDTGSWIKHQINGLIYNPNDDFFSKAATDIQALVSDNVLRKNILDELYIVEKQRLNTWDERLSKEEILVSTL
ncbi:MULTISPECIES: glycosyltransferase [unclassified Acinetobacter]|uniref:glycosyltransferase n=1 Tax=unclassified Acinetobacter TaxID=196816 RepID=UPI0015D16A77|nr:MULTISPECIES: glycosyltransferase [unclassified Acinetobacter]